MASRKKATKSKTTKAKAKPEKAAQPAPEPEKVAATPEPEPEKRGLLSKFRHFVDDSEQEEFEARLERALASGRFTLGKGGLATATADQQERRRRAEARSARARGQAAREGITIQEG